MFRPQSSFSEFMFLLYGYEQYLTFQCPVFSWVFVIFVVVLLSQQLKNCKQVLSSFSFSSFHLTLLLVCFLLHCVSHIFRELLLCATISIKYYTRTHVGDAFCDCQPVSSCGTIPTVHFKWPQCLRLSTWSTSSINLHSFPTFIQYHSHFAIFCN